MSETYRCLCGAQFTTPWKRTEHYRVCKQFWWKLRAEYRRIAKSLDSDLIQGTQWDRLRNPAFPAYLNIQGYVGTWVAFQAWNTNGEVVEINGKQFCLPAAPAVWSELLEPGRFTSEYASREGMIDLIVKIFQVAATESAGRFAHWQGVSPKINQAATALEAAQWLTEQVDFYAQKASAHR